MQDPTLINDLTSLKPLIGDQKLLTFVINAKPEQISQVIKRNWQAYSKDKFVNVLSDVDFNFEADQVQAYWNKFEMALLPVIDNVAPLELFLNNSSVNSIKPMGVIKRKVNL